MLPSRKIDRLRSTVFDKWYLVEVKRAAARARFLRELIGVDSETLKTWSVDWWESWPSLVEEGSYYDFYWAIRQTRKWRKPLPKGDGTGSKAVLLAALEAARTDFHISADLVPESERESRPVCGVWTLKDVLGHLADWDDLFMKWLKIGLGEDVPPFAFDADGDAQNAKMAEARKKQSWRYAWKDHNQNRQRIINLITATSETDLNQRYTGERRMFPTAYHCAWSALEHYLDHAAILRRELGVPIPKFLLTFKGPYT